MVDVVCLHAVSVATELAWFEYEIPMVKLLRAHGGCLGIERR